MPSSSDSSSVAGLLLAGGESRRFGEDKARYPVDGVPMILHVYEALCAVADSVTVSVGAEGTSYTNVLPADVRHVEDRVLNAGPIAGLQAGFLAVQAPWVLVAACDLPNVTPNGFRMLLSARRSEVDAVVVRTPDDRWHPLFAGYRREPTLRAVEACLEEEAYALHALLDRVTVREVQVPSHLVHNVNRRSDLD